MINGANNLRLTSDEFTMLIRGLFETKTEFFIEWSSGYDEHANVDHITYNDNGVYEANIPLDNLITLWSSMWDGLFIKGSNEYNKFIKRQDIQQQAYQYTLDDFLVDLYKENEVFHNESSFLTAGAYEEQIATRDSMRELGKKLTNIIMQNHINRILTTSVKAEYTFTKKPVLTGIFENSIHNKLLTYAIYLENQKHVTNAIHWYKALKVIKHDQFGNHVNDLMDMLYLFDRLEDSKNIYDKLKKDIATVISNWESAKKGYVYNLQESSNETKAN